MLGRVAPIWFLLLPITLFLRMALNAIDGMLAREHNMKSKLGAILNELCDVISDSALYLTFLPCCTSSLLLLVIFLAVLSEYTGVLGVMTSGVRAYDGPMGKSDRAFLFGVIAIFIAFSLIPKNIFDIALVIIGILLVLTCINRAKSAIRQ